MKYRMHWSVNLKLKSKFSVYRSEKIHNFIIIIKSKFSVYRSVTITVHLVVHDVANVPYH